MSACNSAKMRCRSAGGIPFSAAFNSPAIVLSVIHSPCCLVSSFDYIRSVFVHYILKHRMGRKVSHPAKYGTAHLFTKLFT